MLLDLGVSGHTADIILAPWRMSTKKQYGSYIQRWMCFCEREKVNSFNPYVNCVLKFLSELFQGGLGYSAINTAKSAISSLTAVVSNVVIGSNTLVQRFMKGIFSKKKNMSPKKYCHMECQYCVKSLSFGGY